MWKVEETEDVKAQFAKDFKNGLISFEDITILKKWTQLMEKGGVEEICKHPIFDDHALDGDWKGYRSSCFSRSGRIIYKEENGRFIIADVRITPDHNYKR